MSEIIHPATIEIGGGFLVTYKGTPLKCVYWELVGWNGSSETVSVGALIDSITVNDINGFSVNRYIASTNSGDSGKIERIKVSENA